MDNYKTFSLDRVRDMNCQPLWQGTIHIPNGSNPSVNYKLVATGDADVRGRIYVALPSNLVIDDDIKRRYKLWI